MPLRGWVFYRSVVPGLFSCFYRVDGFTLWPFVCLRKSRQRLEEEMGARALDEFINHEQIHIAQASELCCVLMYLLWVFEFLKGLACVGDSGWKCCACMCDPRRAYVWNRLEQEAFDHQSDLAYLDSRPLCAWAAYPTAEVAQRWWGAQGSSVDSGVHTPASEPPDELA